MFVHICGTRAASREDGQPAKWPTGDLKYHESLSFARLTREQIAAAYGRAAAQWCAVAGLQLSRTENIDDADIVATTGYIDGPGGVLALSDLPYGATESSVMRQTFDVEDWGPETLDMLEACICHEIGHALGLEHIPGVGALLDPYIVPGRDAPQSPDIEAMQARYGAPVATVNPTVPASPAEASALETIGAKYAPYVVGAVADALVVAAGKIEAGYSIAVDFQSIVNSLSASLSAVLFPAIGVVTDLPQALRECAKGLAYSVRK